MEGMHHCLEALRKESSGKLVIIKNVFIALQGLVSYRSFFGEGGFKVGNCYLCYHGKLKSHSPKKVYMLPVEAFPTMIKFFDRLIVPF